MGSENDKPHWDSNRDDENRNSDIDNYHYHISGKKFEGYVEVPDLPVMQVQVWHNIASYNSQSVQDYSMPHLTLTENLIRWYKNLQGYSWKTIAKVVKKQKGTVRPGKSRGLNVAQVKKIFFNAQRKVREGYVGEWSRKKTREHILVKKDQKRDEVIHFRNR